MESTLADAAATFRVTSDIASSLAVDGQPTGKLVVNSVGDILRHEKLRRLEKVSRFLLLIFCGNAYLPCTVISDGFP